MGNESSSWLLLRVPRTSGATVMSGVLSLADGYVTTVEGKDIPTVCDALLENAKRDNHPVGKLTLITPLDGRHGLSHVVLEESQKRSWEFSRHLPYGSEKYLLDTEGADACVGLELPKVSETFEALTEQVKEAIGDSELGEALSVLRQMLTLAWKHYGPWHTQTLWAASNLLRVAGGTGATANIDQARGLIEYIMQQPYPSSFDIPLGVLRKLDEIAKNAMQAGKRDFAVQVMEKSIDVAKQAFGDGHANHLAVQNNTCLLLSALKSPKAEPSMRELLRLVKQTLGEKHPNVAVVLMNLAELLENLGRAEEAVPLKAEAQAIRANAS